MAPKSGAITFHSATVSIEEDSTEQRSVRKSTSAVPAWLPSASRRLTLMKLTEVLPIEGAISIDGGVAVMVDLLDGAPRHLTLRLMESASSPSSVKVMSKLPAVLQVTSTITNESRNESSERKSKLRRQASKKKS